MVGKTELISFSYICQTDAEIVRQRQRVRYESERECGLLVPFEPNLLYVYYC